MILFQAGTSLTALAIVKERERGTMAQLIVPLILFKKIYLRWLSIMSNVAPKT